MKNSKKIEVWNLPSSTTCQSFGMNYEKIPPSVYSLVLCRLFYINNIIIMFLLLAYSTWNSFFWVGYKNCKDFKKLRFNYFFWITWKHILSWILFSSLMVLIGETFQPKVCKTPRLYRMINTLSLVGFLIYNNKYMLKGHIIPVSLLNYFLSLMRNTFWVEFVLTMKRKSQSIRGNILCEECFDKRNRKNDYLSMLICLPVCLNPLLFRCRHSSFCSLFLPK